MSFKLFLSFCLISSSVYLINDSVDLSNDKDHPYKKFRAIASGLVSISTAIKLSSVFIFLSLLIGFSLNYFSGLIIILYFFIQMLYCFFLKKIPFVELLCIASGFVIRSIAGGLATGISISNLFLICVGMLSLFLAIEKRKGEIILLKINKTKTRKVLKNYSLSLIRIIEIILILSTVFIYSFWVYGFSENQLIISTIPLVVYGLFKYSRLSENLEKQLNNKLRINLLETPENLILFDKTIQVTVLLWFLIIIFNR